MTKTPGTREPYASVCSFLFFLMFVLPMIPARAQSIDTDSWYRITSVWQGDGKSLDILDDDDNDNHPFLNATAESPSQYWKFVSGNNGHYRLVNERYGPTLSLDIINDGAPNKKLILVSTGNVSGQFWRILANPDGTFRITSMWLGPDKSLDVVNDGQNRELIMSQSASFSGQFWKLTRKVSPKIAALPVIDTAPFYRLTNLWLGDEKSLEIYDDGTNQNHPMVNATNENSAQYWKLVPAENGYYRLTNQQYGAGKSLDVINDGQNNRLILAPTNNYSGQFWKLTPNDDGTYRITSLWQGDTKSLDMVNDGQNNEIILNPAGNYSGQFWKLTKQTIAAPRPLPPPVVVPVVAVKNKLMAGEALTPGMRVTSANGHFFLIQQTDGNLVVYNGEDKATWASGKYGQNVEKCVMQQDGNLVQYLPNHIPAWASNTNGNEGAYLIVQDDGNVVIYRKDLQPLWATNTAEKTPAANKDKLVAGEELLPGMKIISADGSHTLIQQEDGNMVVYNGDGKPTWASGKNGQNIEKCVMQKDGNLVQYLPYHVPVWASNTNGNEGAYLVMQNDGNLVIYDRYNMPLWASDTAGR
jgi:hypothetical protein